MMKRFQKGQFNMNDLKAQLEQMMKMGGLEGVMKMMPGMGKMSKAMDESGMDDKVFKRQIALIQSMTPRERRNPQLLQASRKKRIAKGAGLEVLKMQRQMGDMMKKMGKMGKKGMLKGAIGQMFGKGGGGGEMPAGMPGLDQMPPMPGGGGKPMLPGLGGGLPPLSGFGKKK